MMKHVYSVGQVNKYIKNMFAQDFMLHHISIKGEVSNCKYHSSGHIYFTMKDADGTINAIMFAGNRREGLKFQMKEGDRVVVTGSVEVYERDGRYQIYARTIERDGEGNLYLKFEALKRELEEMGMFAEEYKQPIPTYAKTVGIVTAETGAAIQDIRNIAGRRNPYVQLILCPALVQGEGAADSIVEGIRRLDVLNLDVLIVGRGGGSIEDLWAFNEEKVARAVFSCHTPVISAVGHETDTTIIDFVADLRAPTPSAAAELAVSDRAEQHAYINQLGRRCASALDSHIRFGCNEIKRICAELSAYGPMQQIISQRQTLDSLFSDMQSAALQAHHRDKLNLSVLAGRLDALSPLRILSGGYAAVERGGKLISKTNVPKEGDDITVTAADIKLTARVTSSVGNGGTGNG